jgi:hypothetical protein
MRAVADDSALREVELRELAARRDARLGEAVAEVDATVRWGIQQCAATSVFDIPVLTSCASCRSIGVGPTEVDGSRLRAASPDARNTRVAQGDRRSSAQVGGCARRRVVANRRAGPTSASSTFTTSRVGRAAALVEGGLAC